MADADEIVVDSSVITTMPPVTLSLVLAVVVGALVGFSSWGDVVVLHPRTLLRLHVWTLLTYPFADTNLLNVLITLLSIPIFGRLLENLYGPAVFARYLVLVVVVTGLLCCAVALVEPSVTSSLDAWFDVRRGGYYGFQVILMACFVALKQAMPESVIALALVVRVRLKMLPLVTLSLTLAASLVLPSRGALPMALSLVVSWCYLRFFASMAGPGATGDLRDSFSLASFFPPAAQSAVLPVSRFIDSLRCWPAVRVAGAGGAAFSSVASVPVAPVAMTQAAREHRAIATELVNKRLETLDRSGAHEGSDGDTTITFMDEGDSKVMEPAPASSSAAMPAASDASFVDITPIKKSPSAGPNSLE